MASRETKPEGAAVEPTVPETPPAPDQTPSATPVAETPPADSLSALDAAGPTESASAQTDGEPSSDEGPVVTPDDTYQAEIESGFAVAVAVQALSPALVEPQPQYVNGRDVSACRYDAETDTWVPDPTKAPKPKTDTLWDRICGAFPNERQQAVFRELLGGAGYPFDEVDDGK